MRLVILIAQITAMCLAAPTVFGQATTPGTAQQATIPFVDKTFGYDLQVPAGWNYDRAGFFGPGGSLGTLRGAAAGGRETLQILVFRDQVQESFPKWVDYFSEQLGKLSGSKSVRVKGGESSNRPSAYVAVRAQIGFDQTRTLYYCVQLDADVIWVFSYAWANTISLNETETNEDTANVVIPAGFTRLTETLRIFYDPEAARKLAEALQRGREFLALYELQDGIRKLRTDNELRYYEMLLAGKPIGFMTRQFNSEAEPTRFTGKAANAKGGVRVRERAYRFADDGAVDYSRVDIFSSRDGETDLYEMVQAAMPPPGAPDRGIWIARDQCVREGDTLFSTYATNQDRGLPTPRQPIKLDDSYLGLGWVRLLPALIGAETRPMLGFTIYDSETRTLVTHTIKRLGEQPLPGEPGKQALKFERREGFVETPGVFYSDEFGNMLRYEAGDLVLRQSDETTIDEKYGNRRNDADRRFQLDSQTP